jgi:hypothetical protein
MPLDLLDYYSYRIIAPVNPYGPPGPILPFIAELAGPVPKLLLACAKSIGKEGASFPLSVVPKKLHDSRALSVSIRLVAAQSSVRKKGLLKTFFETKP